MIRGRNGGILKIDGNSNKNRMKTNTDKSENIKRQTTAMMTITMKMTMIVQRKKKMTKKVLLRLLLSILFVDIVHVVTHQPFHCDGNNILHHHPHPHHRHHHPNPHPHQVLLLLVNYLGKWHCSFNIDNNGWWWQGNNDGIYRSRNSHTNLASRQTPTEKCRGR